MKTRAALSAQKPIVSDFSLCISSDFADGGAAAKALSEIAFTSSQLSAIAGAGTIRVPSTIGDASFTVGSDRIQSRNDTDFFAVGLTAGQAYTFSLRGTGAIPLTDPLMALFTDPEGDGFTLSAIDDDGGDGLNSLLTITAAYTGTHVIGVQATGDAVSGNYTLSVIPRDGADEPGTFAGATALTHGQVYYGFIDFIPSVGARPYGKDFGEVDTFKITVVAGKGYTVEVSGGADYASDFQALPPGELDTFVVVRRANGSIVASNDDASFALGDIGSGVSFIAGESGTYFVDVFSYVPWTGGYSIISLEHNLATLNPLDAINWDSADNMHVGADGVLKVYFAVPGENFGELADNGVDPLQSFGWNAFEKQQLFDALQEFSKILGITYVETTDVHQADFRVITTTSDDFGAYFYPQDNAFGTAQGIGAFNVDSGGWNFDQQQSLLQGGFAFAVILHEFGHAHGLSHPHDNGGGSEIMAGVFGPFDSYGFFDLNQGVYTVMSYNDAWPLHPDGPSPFTQAGIDNGWSGTLNAFDIAMLQQRYGVHPDFATGNDSYVLKDVAAVGTYYSTIYDTGGVDEIRYDGRLDARIDLTAATLDYSPTGGGVLSFVDTVKGGYTIANGVVIENAAGGSGNDGLIGNSAANLLRGNAGNDNLLGRAGADRLEGGAGNDTLDGGTGNDILVGGDGRDIFAFDDNSGSDQIFDLRRNTDKIDVSDIDANINAAGNQSFTFIGAAGFTGSAGQLRAFQSGGSNFVAGDVNGDGVADFLIQTNVLVSSSDILFV